MDPHIVVPIVGGLHVEEAEHVVPLVDDDDGVEAALAGSVAGQVHGVDTPVLVETDTSVAPGWATL